MNDEPDALVIGFKILATLEPYENKPHDYCLDNWIIEHLLYA
jgi:hypothetical protein